MPRSTAVVDGAEVAIETGTGWISKLDPPEGRRNAYVEVKDENPNLRYPFKAWVDTHNGALWEAVQQLHRTGDRVEYRIETHRKENISRHVPLAELEARDKVKRLVSVGAQTHQEPHREPRPVENRPEPYDSEPEPHRGHSNDFEGEFRRLSDLLDKGLATLREQGLTYAHSEMEYRQAKSKAWFEAPEGTVPFREAWVNAETAELRHARDVADALRQAALEAVRSRRQQLSALQSLLGAHRAEAELTRFEP